MKASPSTCSAPRSLCLRISVVFGLSLLLGASFALADNAREIVGNWEMVDLKAGSARIKPDSKQKLKAAKRYFDGAGGIRDRGSLVNTGSYKFISEQLLEITANGKTEQWKARIVGDSLVLTRMDGSIKLEEKWKRVK